MIVTVEKYALDRLVNRDKNYILRAFPLPRSIRRIWIYEKSPRKAIDYVCEIETGVQRNSEDIPLQQYGMFGDMDRDDRNSVKHAIHYAYKILSIEQFDGPITLKELCDIHGFQGSPQKLADVPQSLLDCELWRKLQQRMSKSQMNNRIIGSVVGF